MDGSRFHVRALREWRDVLSHSRPAWDAKTSGVQCGPWEVMVATAQNTPLSRTVRTALDGELTGSSCHPGYTFSYTLGVRYVHGEGANQYRDRGTYVEMIKSRYGVAPWALTARTNGSLGQQFDRLVEDSRQSGCGRHDHGAGR